ncbi:hypothetical protein C8R44DRAFT_860452 [Mycena epipterygia]|nr:hypothetical protein C8R44DRAFT_860452 [Mycena epipterygia]
MSRPFSSPRVADVPKAHEDAGSTLSGITVPLLNADPQASFTLLSYSSFAVSRDRACCNSDNFSRSQFSCSRVFTVPDAEGTGQDVIAGSVSTGFGQEKYTKECKGAGRGGGGSWEVFKDPEIAHLLVSALTAPRPWLGLIVTIRMSLRSESRTEQV